VAPKIPTDLEFLEEIFVTYYDRFADFKDSRNGPDASPDRKSTSGSGNSRSSKIWVPIDIDALARKFSTDPDLIFGRLYYHLNEKYSHDASDGSKLDLFAIRIGADRHCINFPYLTSILAGLRDEQKKFRIATGIAGLSLIISLISIYIASQA